MSTHSQISTNHSPVLPPPTCLQSDQLSLADRAPLPLRQRHRFPFLSFLPDLRRPSSKRSGPKQEQNESPKSIIKRVSPQLSPMVQPETLDSNSFISLNKCALAEDDHYTDKFQWAVIYENQRGITGFSIPYYSSQSLLPMDPAPFTIPSDSSDPSKQPSVSFKEYPLPDGTWRWVSTSWMIDMRLDMGNVQHDGFEYNWMFRKHHWRAEVGPFSTGGWVRRRRWLRLMMRPATQRLRHQLGDGDTISTQTSPASSNAGSRRSVALSLPPSVMSAAGPEVSADLFNLSADVVWKGDDVEADWARCHNVMKYLGRDGRKLELWKRWLAPYGRDGHRAYDAEVKGKQRQKQWTEDETLMPSESAADMEKPLMDSGSVPPVEYITAVLRKHGNTLIHSFIFPDSRAQFLELLGPVGLLPELNIGLGVGWSASDVEFWSYFSEKGEEIRNVRPCVPVTDGRPEETAG